MLRERENDKQREESSDDNEQHEKQGVITIHMHCKLHCELTFVMAADKGLFSSLFTSLLHFLK